MDKKAIKEWVKESNTHLPGTRFKIVNKYFYYFLVLYFILSLIAIFGGVFLFYSILDFIKTYLPELNTILVENKDIIVDFIKG